MLFIKETASNKGSPKLFASFFWRALHATTKALEFFRCSFFFLISQNALKERKRGATHSTQGVYKGNPKEKKISEKENPAN
jgi:hypothetical protein